MAETATGKSPSYYAWKRFKSNGPAMAGLVFIVLMSIAAILGSLITPDATPDANRQVLEVETRKPGFTTTIIKKRQNAPAADHGFFYRMLFGEENPYIHIPVNNYSFGNGYVFFDYYADEGTEALRDSLPLADVAYPLSSENLEQRIVNGTAHFTTLDGEQMQVPLAQLQQQVQENFITQKTYWLGTDRFGRDMFSRLVLGARVSLAVGFIAVFISLIIGLTLGSIAGFFRGFVDDAVMWLINVIWSIPTLLLVIAISFALGRGFWQVFIAVGLSMWVDVARVVRGQILSVREKEFVEAGTALGYRSGRIITKHILPNIMGPVIVIAAANFATAILLEAGLSFLGIGVQPPTPSWGYMINEHFGYLLLDAAYLALLPGFAIILTVLSFYLLGNGLRDAFEPRSGVF